MEKLNFKTVEEVAEYLENKCYNFYLETDYENELNNIEVDGMKKFLPQDKKHEYDIYFGLDRVVAIFATEDKIEYIWKTSDINDFNDFKYDAMVVDNEEIANAIAEYSQYLKNGGCFDVSKWIFEEYCNSRLSIDYEVLTTIGRIWN